MSDAQETVRKTLLGALAGRSAHAPAPEVFDGLDWESAGRRPGDAPHSIFRQLQHLVYWQEFALRWLAGEQPQTPAHDADSWPGSDGPSDRREWQREIERFKSGLAELQRLAAEADLLTPIGPKTALEVLHIVASHNSYHAGQVAALRRALGAWPPPGGGLTW